MKKLLILLLGVFSFSQDLDFQQLCIDCAEAEGYYCGDDPANWTQYAPNGCVPNGPNLFFPNDQSVTEYPIGKSEVYKSRKK